MDLALQANRLIIASSRTGNERRANRVSEIYDRYQSNIMDSPSYQAAMRKADANPSKRYSILNKADERAYPRSTYMGLRQASGGKG